MSIATSCPNLPSMFATLTLTLAVVALCVIIHYEMLMRLSPFIHSLPISRRQIVVIGVMLALAAHVTEVWVFAGGYYYALQPGDIGYFTGKAPMEDFYDCLYLSFITYRTLGMTTTHANEHPSDEPIGTSIDAPISAISAP
jgi:hypothetical protein